MINPKIAFIFSKNLYSFNFYTEVKLSFEKFRKKNLYVTETAFKFDIKIF